MAALQPFEWVFFRRGRGMTWISHTALSMHGHISRRFLQTYLVIYQNLHRVVSPLYEDQFVGLTRNCVWERCAHSGGRVGFEPHAHGEGVHLRQTLLHFGVHVVGSQRKGELEFIQGPVFPLTCGEENTQHLNFGDFFCVCVFFTLSNTSMLSPMHTSLGFT